MEDSVLDVEPRLERGPIREEHGPVREECVPRGESASERGDDGHRHGNFKHYYAFHNASAERFNGLVPGSFQKMWQALDMPDTFSVLDIGCNEGDLTMELLRVVQSELPGVQCEAYGIDFDRSLIEEAQRRYRDQPRLQFFVVDVMAGSALNDFLRAKQLEGQVAVVSCLRVSMWVHLNHGNPGLTRLLDMLCRATSCALILDPQKLSYYKKACNRNAKLGISPFPYSLEDLAVCDELPTWCLEFCKEEFQLSEHLHRDIARWGGTLLCVMRGRARAGRGDGPHGEASKPQSLKEIE